MDLTATNTVTCSSTEDCAVSWCYMLCGQLTTVVSGCQFRMSSVMEMFLWIKWPEQGVMTEFWYFGVRDSMFPLKRELSAPGPGHCHFSLPKQQQIVWFLGNFSLQFLAVHPIRHNTLLCILSFHVSLWYKAGIYIWKSIHQYAF